MDWHDGSYYEGEWCKGLQDGEGRLCLPDGRVKEGIFRQNKLLLAGKLPLTKSTAQMATIMEDISEHADDTYAP